MYGRYVGVALGLIRVYKERGESSLFAVCCDMGIRVKYIEGNDFAKGYTMLVDGQAYIFLKRGQTSQKMKYTLAHEMGHILLGHLGDWREIPGRKLSISQQEKEAVDFTEMLLKSGW